MSIIKLLLATDDKADQSKLREKIDQTRTSCLYEFVASVAEAHTKITTQTYDATYLSINLIDDKDVTLLNTLNTHNIPLIILAEVGEEDRVIPLIQQLNCDYLLQDCDYHYLKLLPIVAKRAIASLRSKQQLKELTESQKAGRELLQAVINAVPERISIKDAAGHYFLVNDKFSKFYHASLEAFISESYVEANHKNSVTQQLNHFRKTVANSPKDLAADKVKVIDGSSKDQCFERYTVPISLLNQSNNFLLEIEVDNTDYRQISEENAFLTLLLDQIPQAIIATNLDRQITVWNRSAELLYQWRAAEVIGRNVNQVLFPLDPSHQLDEILERVQSQGEWEGEIEIYRKNGETLPVQLIDKLMWNKEGEPIAYVLISSDNYEHLSNKAEQTFQEYLSEGQRRVLERLALDCPLSEILTLLVKIIEEQAEGHIGSVLLLEGQHLRHGAAPNLPEDYVRAIDGIEINPQCGSCGTAAFRQEPVVVTDIATDPLWINYRELALRFNLRACWSMPVFSKLGNVLGTFALYHREPYSPTSQDWKLVNVAANLAALAIERKQTQSALAQSENRFRATFEQAAVGICHVSLDGHFLRFNQQFCKISGYPPKKLNNLTFQELTYPEDLPLDLRMVHQFLRGKLSTYTVEKCYIRRDRTLVWVNLTVSLVNDLGDEPPYFIAIVEDISDRKQAELNLRQSESRYASLAAAVPVGIFRTNKTGYCIYVNDRWCEISGLTPSQAMGNGWIKALHPNDREFIAAEWKLAIQKNRSFQAEYRFQRADDTISWVFAQATAEYSSTGRVTGFVGTITDITSRKQIEAELYQLNQDLEQRVGQRTAELQEINRQLQQAIAERKTIVALVENSTDFIATATPSGQMTYLNRAGRQLIGLDETAEITNYHIPDFHFSEDWEDLQQTFIQALAKGESYQAEVNLRHFQTQASIPVMHSAFPIKQPKTGKILAIAGILKDITKQKQVESQLQKLSHRLTIALKSAAIGTWEWDIVQDIVTCDERVCELYGYEPGHHALDYESWMSRLHPDDRSATEATIKQSLETGEELEAEFRIVPPSGSVRFIRTTGLVQRDLQNTPVSVIGVYFDITESKLAEAALKKSERLYATLTAIAPVAIFRMDTSENCTYVNDRWSEMAGRPKEFALGKGWMDTLHPEDRASIIQRWTDACTQLTCLNSTVSCLESRLLRPDSSITWYYLQVTRELDGEGTIVGYIGTLTDITERKQAEIALQESQQFLQTVLDTFPQSVFWKDRDSRYLGCNRNFLRDAGLASVTDLVGKSDYDLPWSREQAEAYRANDQEVIHTSEAKLRIVESLINAKGDLIWLETNKLPLRNRLGEVIGILGTYQDITARKQTEQQLQCLSERLNLALQSAPIGIWEWDIINDVKLWDDQMRKLYGIDVGEAGDFYQAWLDSIHPADQVATNTAIQKALRGEQEYEAEFRVIRPDGKLHYIKAYGLVERNQQGEPQRMVGLNIDISDRKQAEQALRSSEARFRNYFEQSLIGMAITSPERGWIEVNDRLCEILGYPRAELTHLTWSEITHPDDLATDLLQFNRVLSGEAEGYSIEKRFIRKDGMVIYATISARCIRQDDGAVDYFVALVQDITDRYEAEERLRESEASLLEAQRVAHIGNWSFDTQKQTIYWSEELYRMFGFDPAHHKPAYDEFLQRIHPGDRATITQCIDTAIAKGTPYTIDYRVLLPDGSTRYHEGRGRVIQDRAGKVVKLYGTALDISHRKQVELELQKNRDLREAIFEKSTDALFIVNPETELILDCNQRAVEMFEAGNKFELINKCGNTLQKQPFTAAQLKAVIEEVTAKGFWSQEIEYVTQKGRIFWANIAGTVVQVGSELIRLVRLSDVTDRKEIEQLFQQQLYKEQLFVSVLMRIRDSLELGSILTATVQEVRQVLDADRILVCQLAPDHSGTVVSEACKGSWQPMLGLTTSEAHVPETYFEEYLQQGYYVVEDCCQEGIEDDSNSQYGNLAAIGRNI